VNHHQRDKLWPVLTGTVAKLAAVDNDDTDIKLQTPPPPLPPHRRRCRRNDLV